MTDALALKRAKDRARKAAWRAKHGQRSRELDKLAKRRQRSREAAQSSARVQHSIPRALLRAALAM